MASVDDDFEFDDRPTRIDLDALWEFLSTQAYWGRWRTRDDVRRQLASAWRVVGVYERASGHMVGFARAVSDGVAIAYLADVYVLPSARGRGLGKRLVAAMIEEGPGADFRWMLHTADAHGLYEPFGFGPPPSHRYLERPSRVDRVAGTPSAPGPEPVMADG
jgi:GNAT superfamily N-acetyltransferase